MNTFLPYASFVDSAACLDWRRLGKQRVECLQILNALTGKSRGWVNHPCTNMWRGHGRALVMYADAMCHEWTWRGYKDTTRVKIWALADEFLESEPMIKMPPWFGDERVHASHRANLLRKDQSWYGRYGWVEAPTQGYYWPSVSTGR